jgi:hypothetical protein
MQFHPPCSILAILFAHLISRQSVLESSYTGTFRARDRVYPFHKAFIEPPDEVESQDIVRLELEGKVVMLRSS